MTKPRRPSQSPSVGGTQVGELTPDRVTSAMGLPNRKTVKWLLILLSWFLVPVDTANPSGCSGGMATASTSMSEFFSSLPRSIAGT